MDNYGFKLNDLESEDIIYHYTSSEIALQYILYSRQLRLSPRNNAIDPIEMMFPDITSGTLAHDDYEMKEIVNGTTEEVKIVEKEIRKRREDVRQLSFCMNNKELENEKPLEYFGCLKPRMWDQYANNYKGVCLAFSLKELRKQLKPDNFIHKKVEYVNYSTLIQNHDRINCNMLYDLGIEKYKAKHFEKIDRDIFRKHEDYLGETEYRVCSYSNNEFVNLKFNDALKAIVISGHNSPYFQQILIDRAKDLNVEYMIFKWKGSGLQINHPEKNYEIQKLIISKEN